MLLSGMMTFSNYYCYDIPASISSPIQIWMGSEYYDYQWRLNLLYSLYSLPNVFMPLLGGHLMDRYSPALTILVFLLLVGVGQFMFFLGTLHQSWALMFLARFIFGLGCESLDVGQADLVTKLFKNQMGFAFGVNLLMARLATTLTYNLSPIFAARFGVPLAVFGGSAVWLVSAVCAAALMHIIGSNQDYSEDDGDTIREPAQNVNPSQVRNFGISFWYLFVIIISLYGSVVPFFPIASDCCFY
jgi:MFS family permease